MGDAYIIGKGPSARRVGSESDTVVGLNQAAYPMWVGIACCADTCMLQEYGAKGIDKPIVVGNGFTVRGTTLIRMPHKYSSSAALAIHYLAGLGYKTINLVGFDAYISHLKGVDTTDTAKYRHVNKSIELAQLSTGVKLCVHE